MPRRCESDLDATDPKLRRHRYGWVVEGLIGEPSFLVKPMFGLLACYLRGRLVLVLADRREPWRGVFVPTERAAQPALRAELPALDVHPVLGKWLRLRERSDDFEETVARVVELALAGDPRVGVEPSAPRKRRARQPTARRSRARSRAS